jgi:membrane protease YdiL (CAAX protease family)
MTGILQSAPAQWVKGVLWNADEKRFRAGWRMLLHIVVVIVLASLIAAAVRFVFEVLLTNLLGSSRGLSLAYTLASSQMTWIALVASLWVAGRFFDKRPFKQFGFAFSRRWWLDFAFGLLLGALLMAGIFAVERALGWAKVTGAYQTTSSSFTFGILLYIALFIAVGIEEESLTRGYWLKNLAEGFNSHRLGPRTALLISYFLTSSIFGLLHLGNANASWVSTLNLIVAGLFLGLPVVLTGDLAISIGIHMTWNFFQGNVFGFPVSGSAPGTTYITIQQGGPALWTGGAFGPEAGLIGIIAILIGSGLIWLWLRFTRGKLALRSDLAVYSPAARRVAAPAAEPER